MFRRRVEEDSESGEEVLKRNKRVKEWDFQYEVHHRDEHQCERCGRNLIE